MPTISEEIIAQRVDERIMPDGRKIAVTSQLHRLGGNARPYFSVQADVWYPDRRGRYPSEPDMCGCCHEQALEAFPELAPVVALHLADDRGRPMHAAENSAFWLGGCRASYGEPYTPKHVMRHLRIDRATADHLAKLVALAPDPVALMHKVCAQHAARWQAEAEAALRIIRRQA